MNEKQRIEKAIKFVYETIGYVDIKMTADYINLPTHKVREVVEERYKKNANDDEYHPKQKRRKRK